MRNMHLFHYCIPKTLIIRAPRIMPWWAHSRKARFSWVYAVKSVDPFCLGKSLPSLGQVFGFWRVNRGEWR